MTLREVMNITRDMERGKGLTILYEKIVTEIEKLQEGK